MDYGGGNVLRKYQWDLIHHPRMIIPWLQDDEGARNQLFPDPEFVENFLERLRCASRTGGYMALVEDDASFLGHRANDIVLSDGQEYEFIRVVVNQTSDIKIHAPTVTSQGDKTYYRWGKVIEIEIMTKDKDKFDAFLDPSDADWQTQKGNLISKINSLEGCDGKYLIEYFAECGPEELPDDARCKYLTCIAGETWVGTKDEATILTLFESIKGDKGKCEAMISCLEGDTKLLGELITSVDGKNQTQMLETLTKIYHTAKQDKLASEIQALDRAHQDILSNQKGSGDNIINVLAQDNIFYYKYCTFINCLLNFNEKLYYKNINFNEGSISLDIEAIQLARSLWTVSAGAGPFDLVKIVLEEPVDALKGQDGDIIYTPAFNLLLLGQAIEASEYSEALDVGLMVGAGYAAIGRKIGELSTGALIDIVLQTLINYAFVLEGDQATWKNAFDKVDYSQVTFSALEAAAGNTVTENIISCLGNAAMEEGELSDKGLACLEGILTNILTEKVLKVGGNLFAQLKTALKNNPAKFSKSLEKLGITGTEKDDIIKWLKNSVDAGAVFNSIDDVKKYFDPDEFAILSKNFKDGQIIGMCQAVSKSGEDVKLLDDIIGEEVDKLDDVYSGSDLEAQKQHLYDRISAYGCFVAGTMVMQGNSEKGIEDIQVGDEVWSYDIQDGARSLQVVKQVYRREVGELVRIWVGKELIQTTAGHPFFTPDKWKPAGSLEEGDHIIDFEGKERTISKTEHLDTLVAVYNIEVANNQTYYVGQSRLLVHNRCDIPVEIRNIIDLAKAHDLDIDLALAQQLFSRPGITGFLQGSSLGKLADKGQKADFLNDLARSHGTFKPNIGDKVSEIDDDLMAVWRTLRENGNGSPNKRLDFEFLKANKGKSKDEILSNLTISNRTKMVEDLTNLNKTNCAEYVQKSMGDYLGKLRKSISKPEVFKDYIELYKNNTKLYADLTNILSIHSASGTIPITEIEKAFKGYQAHHIIPVNLITANKNLQEILEYAQSQGFDFNDIDNLMFLHAENHLGSHGKYDEVINRKIDELSIKYKGNLRNDDALEDLKGLINEVKEIFAEDFIGQDIKIDTLQF